MTDGHLERGDVVIPKRAAGIIATIVAASFIGAFGWAWALNADIAVMREKLGSLKEDVAFIKSQLNIRDHANIRETFEGLE